MKIHFQTLTEGINASIGREIYVRAAAIVAAVAAIVTVVVVDNRAVVDVVSVAALIDSNVFITICYGGNAIVCVVRHGICAGTVVVRP